MESVDKEQERFAELLEQAQHDLPERLADKLAKLLLERKLTVACAESMTAGLVAHKLTTLAGSSAYFLGGIIAYHSRLKVHLLGLSAQLLAKNTAVSSAVACKMAENVRLKTGADLSVAVVGYAGPQAGPGGEVGLCYIAIADEKRCLVHPFHFEGTRGAIRDKAAEAAVGGLYWRVLGEI